MEDPDSFSCADDHHFVGTSWEDSIVRYCDYDEDGVGLHLAQDGAYLSYLSSPCHLFDPLHFRFHLYLYLDLDLDSNEEI